MTSSFGRATAIALMSFASFTTVAASAAPPTDWNGLEPRKVKNLDSVYVRPNVQFTPYKKVMLDAAEVEFSRQWMKDNRYSRDISRRLDAQDLQRIRSELSKLFHDGFAKELAKGGYVLTETAGDDTIRVSAAMIDLYINAPDTQSAGRSRSYTTDAGSMTLVMEVRDSPTGQVLARVVDGRNAELAGGQMQWTTSLTNRAEAERMIALWAAKLRDGLDQVNGRAKP